MGHDIGLVAAFGAGFLSFVAPCTLVMVPIFVAYIAGIGLTRMEDIGQPRYRIPIFLNTVAFVLGFTVVFVLLGASLGAVSHTLRSEGIWVTRVGGAVIMAFGLVSLGFIKVPFLMQQRVIRSLPGQNIKYLGSFLVGCTISVGMLPCVGAIFGGILVLAGTSGSVAYGSTLLFVYSLGMMIPFLLFGLFAGWGTSFIRRHGHWFRYSGYAAGVLLIALGAVVFTNHLRQLTGYFGFLSRT